MIKTILAAAALSGALLMSGVASAAPVSSTIAIQRADTMLTPVQYRTRTVTRTRIMRPRRICTVRTVRTRTHRGVVIRRIRTCR